MRGSEYILDQIRYDFLGEAGRKVCMTDRLLGNDALWIEC